MTTTRAKNAAFLRNLWIVLLLISIGINFGLVISRLGWFDAKEDPPAEVSAPSKTDAPGAEPSTQSVIPQRLTKKLERMAGELELEGEKRAQFLELQERFFRRSLEMRARTVEIQRALRRELISETPDRQRSEELLLESSEAQRGLEQAFLDNFFDTRQLLDTPEQIRRFQRFMAHVRQLRRELDRRGADRDIEQRLEQRRERRLERQRQRAESQGQRETGQPPPR